jgi:acyl carrier protein
VVDSELLKQLQEIPVAQRASFITEFLQREVQGFLRLAQPPAATSRFLDLGTDSLMAVELRNRLHSQFGGKFTINATAVFDYPTIGGLGEYLAAQLPDAESESGEADSDAAPEASPESDAAPEPGSEKVPYPGSNGAQAETVAAPTSNGAESVAAAEASPESEVAPGSS